ncbi:hypothetical protein RM550_07780 [Streptomyces sp. DSM 41527]|uniref:Uncharacterized protein n=1 Tax=Streptomyces mooreae TaxID=3075523 RepID=A0ABU2T330_9ACTN|nr:hypothetical protein [Streptomyces sp. DSM 41527]MDT0455638.1 hypothetical protein [Streptomyces sp. DSM 41527]
MAPLPILPPTPRRPVMSRGKEGAPKPAELPSAAAGGGRLTPRRRLPVAAPAAVAAEAGAVAGAMAPAEAADAAVGSLGRSV